MDKMAAFLNELKTHRLKKVSRNPDESFAVSVPERRSSFAGTAPSLGSSLQAKVGFPRFASAGSGRLPDDASRVGDKRKRIDEICQESEGSLRT